MSRVKIGKQEMVKALRRSRLKMEWEGGITKHRGSCHWRWRRGWRRGSPVGAEGLGTETQLLPIWDLARRELGK